MMKLICVSPTYTNWRGTYGNYILLIFYSTSCLLNVFTAIFIIRKKLSRHRKFLSFFILKLVCGNAAVSGSQVFIITNIMLNRNDCLTAVIAYVWHHIGLLVASSSLIVLVIFHFKIAIKQRPLTSVERAELIRKAIVYQVAIDTIGILLIIIPILWDHYRAFTFYLAFGVAINAVLIAYLYKETKFMKRIHDTEIANMYFTKRLLSAFKVIQPISCLTAIFKIYYTMVKIVLSRQLATRVTSIATLWAAELYYLSLITIPVTLLYYMFCCCCLMEDEAASDAVGMVHVTRIFLETNETEETSDVSRVLSDTALIQVDKRRRETSATITCTTNVDVCESVCRRHSIPADKGRRRRGTRTVGPNEDSTISEECTTSECIYARSDTQIDLVLSNQLRPIICNPLMDPRFVVEEEH